MTPKECSRLQCMDTLPNLPDNPTKAFEALGNAVNVNIVESISAKLTSPEKAPSRRFVAEEGNGSFFPSFLSPLLQRTQ